MSGGGIGYYSWEKMQGEWLILCATATAFWLRYSGRFISASPTFLVRVTVALCVLFFTPFIGPLLSIGRSWTGREVGEEDQWRIKVHSLAMFSLLTFFIIQMMSFKVPAIHKKLGPVLMFLVLPCIFVELFFNISEIFLRDKTVVLAQSLYGKDATLRQMASVSPVLAGALSLPVHLLVGYCLSLHALYGKRRDIPLHMFHMLSLSLRMPSAGVARFCFQMLFAVSGCQQFGDPLEVVRLQASGMILADFLYVFLLTGFYMTLEPAKRDGSVKTIFTAGLVIHWIECLSACYFGIPILPVCNQVAA